MNAAEDRGNVMFGVDWTKRSVVIGGTATGWPPAGTIQTRYRAASCRRPVTAPARRDARFPTVQSNPPSQAAMDAVWAQYLPNFNPTATPCTGAVAASTCSRVSNTAEVFWNPDGTPFLQNGLNYRGPIMHTTLDGQGVTGVKMRPDGFLEQVSEFEQLLSIPLDRTSAFGRAIYDINDNLRAFAQANYSAVDTSQVAGYIPAITVWQAVIPNDGRAMPADLRTLLNSRTVRTNASGAPIANTGPTAPWVTYRGLDYLGNERSTNETQTYQTMFGVEGRLPGNDWTYEAYVSTGHTTNLYFGFNGSQQRYQSLLSSPNWGREPAPGLPSFVFGAGYQQTCTTGLPHFGGEWPSANCIEAIQAKNKWLTEIEQDIAEFNLQGKIVDMRAGELRFAVGASARRNSFLFEPSEINDDVSVIEQLQGIFVANNAEGTTEVKELYGELLVPVTERLDLEFGYRYSDYDTSGGADTWKALFTYDATDSVTLRGGFQFATRAPNVAELYSGPAVSTVNFPPSDPCSYTTLVPWGNIAANPNRLQVQQLCIDIIGSETSDFGTAGSTAANNFARPGSPFFPAREREHQGQPEPGAGGGRHLDVGRRVEWARQPREPRGVVRHLQRRDRRRDCAARLGLRLSQCFNGNGSSNPTYSLNDPGGYCKLSRATRSTAGARAWRRRSSTPAFSTRRVSDAAVTWTADFGPGALNINTVATFLDRFEMQDNPSEPIIEAAGTLAGTTPSDVGQFDYRIVTTFSYAFGNSQIGLGWRHYPSIKDDDAARDPNTRILPVASYDIFNLFGTYQINDRMEFRGGIDNLLDEEPPVVGGDPGSVALGLPSDNNLGDTNASFYDVLGRRYYIALQMNF